MRFDIYGRFQLDVVRTTNGYEIYELGAEGKRRVRDDIALPADLPEDDIQQALDDLLHELGGTGRLVRRVDERVAAPAGGPTLARHVLTILAVRNLARSTAFYRAGFGWPLRVEAPVYVELELPDGRGLGLYTRDGYAKNTGEMPAAVPEGAITGTELYFHVDDVEVALQRLVAAGASVLSPAAPRDWGDVAAYVADPDGNVVVVAKPVPAASTTWSTSP